MELSTPDSWFVDDKLMAMLWWVKCFNYDYDKYLNALFWDDDNKKIDFLTNWNEWKKYFEQLDYRLMQKWLDWWIINISFIISEKVSKIINVI